MKTSIEQSRPLSRTIQGKTRAANQAHIATILQKQAARQEMSGDKEEPLQAKAENNTGLPDNLKTGVENLSSYSMDDVRVHYNSPKPAQLQALAYTQGTDIHIAPGQEQHLPHETWHVVQQMQGRVQPTMQLQGVNINDNEGLEKEADMMGGKATVQRKVNDNSKDSNQPQVDDILQAHEHESTEYSKNVMQLFTLPKGITDLQEKAKTIGEEIKESTYANNTDKGETIPGSETWGNETFYAGYRKLDEWYLLKELIETTNARVEFGKHVNTDADVIFRGAIPVTVSSAAASAMTDDTASATAVSVLDTDAMDDDTTTCGSAVAAAAMPTPAAADRTTSSELVTTIAGENKVVSSKSQIKINIENALKQLLSGTRTYQYHNGAILYARINAKQFTNEDENMKPIVDGGTITDIFKKITVKQKGSVTIHVKVIFNGNKEVKVTKTIGEKSTPSRTRCRTPSESTMEQPAKRPRSS